MLPIYFMLYVYKCMCQFKSYFQSHFISICFSISIWLFTVYFIEQLYKQDYNVGRHEWVLHYWLWLKCRRILFKSWQAINYKVFKLIYLSFSQYGIFTDIEVYYFYTRNSAPYSMNKSGSLETRYQLSRTRIYHSNLYLTPKTSSHNTSWGISTRTWNLSTTGAIWV